LYWPTFVQKSVTRTREVELLLDELWFRFFKKPVDEKPQMFGDKYSHEPRYYDVLKSYFLNCDWNEVYDFIEFVVAGVSEGPIDIDDPPEALNDALIEKNSAYRMLAG
jgi:hypothetical protein